MLYPLSYGGGCRFRMTFYHGMKRGLGAVRMTSKDPTERHRALFGAYSTVPYTWPQAWPVIAEFNWSTSRRRV